MKKQIEIDGQLYIRENSGVYAPVMNHAPTKIVTAEDAIPIICEIRHERQEHFMTIALNGDNRYVNHEITFKGTANEVKVHPREIFRFALENSATAIIIAHNHPSGSLMPSAADINITRRIAKAAKIIDIGLLDHIIISKRGFTSLKREGKGLFE